MFLHLHTKSWFQIKKPNKKPIILSWSRGIKCIRSNQVINLNFNKEYTWHEAFVSRTPLLDDTKMKALGLVGIAEFSTKCNNRTYDLASLKFICFNHRMCEVVSLRTMRYCGTFDTFQTSPQHPIECQANSLCMGCVRHLPKSIEAVGYSVLIITAK